MFLWLPIKTLKSPCNWRRGRRGNQEIIKHPTIEKAVLCEIDGRVIEIAKEHLPEISCALTDEKVEVIVDDGIKYVNQHKNEFDVIMIDSTDPVGPAVGLFQRNFIKPYTNV